MTNDERIALLRRVADVAPKEMGADCGWQIRYDGAAVTFISEQVIAGLWLRDDIEDASAIIAMLEAMEKAKMPEGRARTGLITPTGGEYRCEVWDEETGVRSASEYGLIRAEAVARAFVRVFGGD